jgi:mono/diheme cytochrome c family protein
MKTHLNLLSIIFSSTILAATTVIADTENGKALYQEKCATCHMVGGDHTVFHQEDKRKMKDLSGLKGQVSMCTQNLNIEWFPDEEKDVVEYLNKQYYHFK